MIRGLRSTSYRGEWYRVRKGGEQRQERIREHQGKAGRGRTGTGTVEGEAGANGEGSGVQGQKGVRW